MWWLMPAVPALSRLEQARVLLWIPAHLALYGKTLFPLYIPPKRKRFILLQSFTVSYKGENVQGHNVPFQGMTPVTLFPTSASRPHVLKVLLNPSSNRLRTKMLNIWAFGWHVRFEWQQWSSGSVWRWHLSWEHIITLFCIASLPQHFDEQIIFWLVQSIRVYSEKRV